MIYTAYNILRKIYYSCSLFDSWLKYAWSTKNSAIDGKSLKWDNVSSTTYQISFRTSLQFAAELRAARYRIHHISETLMLLTSIKPLF